MADSETERNRATRRLFPCTLSLQKSSVMRAATMADIRDLRRILCALHTFRVGAFSRSRILGGARVGKVRLIHASTARRAMPQSTLCSIFLHAAAPSFHFYFDTFKPRFPDGRRRHKGVCDAEDSTSGADAGNSWRCTRLVMEVTWRRRRVWATTHSAGELSPENSVYRRSTSARARGSRLAADSRSAIRGRGSLLKMFEDSVELCRVRRDEPRGVDVVGHPNHRLGPLVWIMQTWSG